jgi:hypothetical protein
MTSLVMVRPHSASYGLYSNAHPGDMGAQSFQNQPFLLAKRSSHRWAVSATRLGLVNLFPHTLDLTSNPNKQLFFLPGEVLAGSTS